MSWLALVLRGDHSGALIEAKRALAMTPNLAEAHGTRGVSLIYSGRLKEGVAAIQMSIRLDPRDPFLAFRLQQLVVGFYFSREYEAAIEAAKQAIRSYPDYLLTYRWLAAALGQLGRIKEARETLVNAITLAPASFDTYVRERAPWYRPEDYAHALEGLQKAGWQG